MKSILKIFSSEAKVMVGAVVLAGCSLGTAVGLLATSAWLISMASTRPPVLVLEVAIVSVRFFGLSRGFFKYSSRLLEHNGALRIQTDLRVKIYERFSRLLPSQYAALHRGNLLSQIIIDVEIVQDLWLRVAGPWIASVVSGVAGVSIIYWLLPACGNAIGIIFLVSAFTIPYLATLSLQKTDLQDNEGELFDQIMQIAESAPESLIFNYDQELLMQVHSQQEKITQVENKNASRSGISSALFFLLLGSSILTSLWYAAQAEINHQLAGINVAVIVLLPLAIFDGMSSLPSAFSQLRLVLGAVARLDPLVQSLPLETISLYERPSQIHLSLLHVLPRIEGVRVSAITAEISLGQTLLITGRSGSGKSSIVNALLGLVPYLGEIDLNGRKIEPSDLALFSTLLQDDYLFGTSIRENLKIGKPDATDDDLYSVLETVELKDFVLTLPNDLETMVGPLGFNFSGGEKQRLKLARVLLRDTPIFILDEPYEFLDSEMVQRISIRVSEKLKARAVIIVSHLPLNIEAIHIAL